MSSPGSGRGGGFKKGGQQIPPHLRTTTKSPTNSCCLCWESLTIWLALDIHVANAPNLEKNLGNNP